MKNQVKASDELRQKFKNELLMLRRGSCVSLEKKERDEKVKIIYLDDQERKRYMLEIKSGNFSYTQGEKLPDTCHMLFGLDRNRQFYGKLGFEWRNYGRGFFGHGSFLSDGYLMAAGELFLVEGRLKYISSNSGHYLPTHHHMRAALYNLHRQGVDLSQVTLISYNHSRSTSIGRGRYADADFYNAMEFLEKHENDCKKYNKESDKFKEEIKKIRDYTNVKIGEAGSAENFKPHRQTIIQHQEPPEYKRQLERGIIPKLGLFGQVMKGVLDRYCEQEKNQP